MAKPKEPTVATPGRAYEQMAPKWRMIDALLGGTDAMRAAGQLYLPQYEAETSARYRVRLGMNSLLNLTRFTLNNLVGRVFKKPIVLHDDVPEAIRGSKDKDEGLAEDIDGQGNNVQVFCYNWFRQGFAKGLSHVLVDFPPAVERADGQPRTRADDAGREPYWVQVAPENLLYARSEVVDGEERLVEVRILEEYVEPVGFGDECSYQVRVLKPGTWELWRFKKIKRGTGYEEKWYLHDSGLMGLAYIPLVTFYTHRTGLMTSDLPLEDLAHLNVTHWQSNSDQRSILTAARFPILACSGSDGEDETSGKKVSLGPYNLLTTQDPQGKFYYVEHTGAAIGAGRQDLRDLEDQMASYGAQFLKKKADIESATGRILDSAETISELQAIALNFKDAVELALRYTADWLKLPTGGQVRLDSHIDLVIDGADLQALGDARKNRDISRLTYLGELKRRQVLADDFDPKKDAEDLSEENDVGLGAGGDVEE